MRPEVALWLNRLGLLLDLLAFFCAAPELLGGRRLQAVTSVYERGMRLLPPVALAAALVALGAFLAASVGRLAGQAAKAIWRLSVVTVTGALLTLAGIVILRVVGRAAPAVISRLAGGEQTNLGQRFLVFGAFLFVLGMALQFVATF